MVATLGQTTHDPLMRSLIETNGFFLHSTSLEDEFTDHEPKGMPVLSYSTKLFTFGLADRSEGVRLP